MNNAKVSIIKIIGEEDSVINKAQKMSFTFEDKVIIKHYRLDKGYGAKRLLNEFAQKPWTKGGLNKLLRKIDETGDVRRKIGSGRPRIARSKNLDAIEDMILSQEDNPGTHISQREIARELSISQASVSRASKTDLSLKAYRKTKSHALTENDMEKRVKRGKRLLRKMTKNNLNKTFFTDEKIFKLQCPQRIPKMIVCTVCSF